MDNIKKRLGNLLSVKSLVTLTLTGVFAYMSVAGKISQDFIDDLRRDHRVLFRHAEPEDAGRA